MFFRRVARVCGAVAALVLCAFVAVQPARAGLAIDIDKSTQQMSVSLDGEPLFLWPVSTGAAGYDTPSGTFTPFRMEKDHFSREWDDAPMPHSVFFTTRGHAIHGSNHLKAIGTPASHGCVRLAPKNAKILFDLVKQEGLAKTRVTLRGQTPGANAAPVARREAPSNTGLARSFSTDGLYYDDDDTVGALPPPPRLRRGERLVREYRNGRTYYYRVVPRRYGYEPPPFYFGR